MIVIHFVVSIIAQRQDGETAPMTDVTQILSQIESGDPSAAEQLLPPSNSCRWSTTSCADLLREPRLTGVCANTSIRHLMKARWRTNSFLD